MQEFTRLVGRYCSYLLPKQAGGIHQILIFETLRMIRRPALYNSGEIFTTEAKPPPQTNSASAGSVVCARESKLREAVEVGRAALLGDS